MVRKRSIPKRQTERPFYHYRQVRKLIVDGKIDITLRALNSASKAFGWNKDDMKKALMSLKSKDFHKPSYKYTNPTIKEDVYKAYNLMGENVYTHIRIENGRLIVDSFKEI